MNHLHHSSPNQPIQGMSGFLHKYNVSSSPVSGFSLQSESSNPSSLPSDGFPGFHETSPRFEETKPQTPNGNTHSSNGFGWESKLPSTPMGTDELGLSGLLSRMNIRDGHDDLRINGHFPSHGFQLDDCFSMKTNHGNVDNRGFQSSFPGSPMNFDEERRLAVQSLNQYLIQQQSMNHLHHSSPNQPIQEMSGIHHKYNVSSSSVSGFSLQSESSTPSSLPSDGFPGFHESFSRFEETKPQTPNRNTVYSNGFGWESKLPSTPMGTDELGLYGDLSEGYRYNEYGIYPNLDDYTFSMRTTLKEAMENPRAEQVLREDLQFHSDAPAFRNLNNLRIQEQILYSAQNETYFNECRNGLDSPSSSHLSSAFGGRLRQGLPMSNRRVVAPSNGRILHSPSYVKNSGGREIYSGEDSLIIQGQSVNYVYNKNCDLSWEHNRDICTGNPSAISSQLDCLSHSRGIPYVNYECSHSPKINYPHFGQPKCISPWEVQGHVYLSAKHPHYSRLLQEKFDKRHPQYVKMIFDGIINHVSELMMDPSGNYLMQKLLDVCTEDQRTGILLMITREPDELVRISLNAYGTRVVQKLIQTLKTRRQIALVISALEHGFIDLIKDPNGNHVVISCLNNFSNEDNKFIFSAATKFCLEIAIHQHGCCVLKSCIDHSLGEHRENLVVEIARNGLLLAQDTYGNYVVQYIIEQKIPSATKTLVSQFQGKYVHLSMQKFSSNVVEKCLNEFDDENKFQIIKELLSYRRFDQLLQHEFANYVVQTALVVSKGNVQLILVRAIAPYEQRLKNSPYGKKLTQMIHVHSLGG